MDTKAMTLAALVSSVLLANALEGGGPGKPAAQRDSNTSGNDIAGANFPA
jgi:hypothetical protein